VRSFQRFFDQTVAAMRPMQPKIMRIIATVRWCPVKNITMPTNKQTVVILVMRFFPEECHYRAGRFAGQLREPIAPSAQWGTTADADNPKIPNEARLAPQVPGSKSDRLPLCLFDTQRTTF
jgi:hypothetical protein